MLRNLVMVCVVALSSAISSQDDVAKDDLKKMKGDWTLVFSEANAKKRTPENFKKFTRKVTDGTFLIMIETEKGVQTVGGKFKLDPSKSPKAVDVEMTQGPSKGESLKGIYKFEDNTQVMCVAGPGKDRPTKFDSQQGTVTVWKRPKEKEPVKEKEPAKDKKDE
jgi:uncharacterized protein (TIGR03067 family)